MTIGLQLIVPSRVFFIMHTFYHGRRRRRGLQNIEHIERIRLRTYLTKRNDENENGCEKLVTWRKNRKNTKRILRYWILLTQTGGKGYEIGEKHGPVTNSITYAFSFHS